MNFSDNLTKSEKRVAEMIAWGSAKKEVADKLHISVRTVENHCKSIYSKLGIQKGTELSVYWFCSHYNISISDSPVKIRVVTGAFMAIIISSLFSTHYINERNVRSQRSNRTTCRSISRTRRNDEQTAYYLDFCEYDN